MAVKRNYRINLRNYGNPPAIMVSQYDENYSLTFEVYDGPLPASGLNTYTVKLVGTRADTLKYSFDGTVTGVANNVLNFTIDTTMTACAGKGVAEIVILDATNDVKFASFNLPVYVEKAAVPDDAIDADVERAQEIAEQVEELIDGATEGAEAWAVGQRGGVDVESTDPTYHNNAKYYSEVAQDIADSIGIDATLSISGKAADAKKTGDEISSLKEELSDMNTATSVDVGKALTAKTVANGKVSEWEFSDVGTVSAEQDSSEKYSLAIGDERNNVIMAIVDGHIRTKNFDSASVGELTERIDSLVDATLSQTGKASDSAMVGYKLCGLYDVLDNIAYIYGVIRVQDGKWGWDLSSKNVYDPTFYAVDDFAVVQKRQSNAYSLNVYFYSQPDQNTYVQEKTLLNVDRYMFTESDAGYYFRIHVASNTTDILDTSTRYVQLLTSRKATVSSKNEDKRNAIAASKGLSHNNFSLLVTTDIHADAVRMLNAVDYLNDMDMIDAGACLGDIKANNSATRFDYYKNAVHNSEKTFFTVVGNHDVGEGTSTSSGVTQQQVYDDLIAPVMSQIGVETTTSYYYKDFADNYLRVIVLNSSDLPDTMASETAFLVDRGILGAFSQAQINWFISTLANTPSGYHVLILMHYVDAEMTADTNIRFQSSKASWTGRTGNAYVGIINDIVTAWVGGTTLTRTYTSDYDNMPVVNVSADFTSRGTGVFVAFLTGHTHRDIIGKFNDYPSQIACVFTLSNMSRANEDDLPKSEGEKSEDTLTVVSIDTTNRKLYLIRVGANIATDFVERADTCMSY